MTTRYFAALAALLVGCAEVPTEAPTPVEAPTTPELSAPGPELSTIGSSRSEAAALVPGATVDGAESTPIHGGFDDPVEIGLLPEVVPPHRDLKRMDVDQLSASIKAVTGGIGWAVGGNDQFEALAQTLGKPDYRDLTSEDLEPSALFQKFLDDAARSACFKLAQSEVNAPPEDRVLMVHAGPEDTYLQSPEKIEQNLVMLLKRFHGRHVEPGTAAIESFRWLYQSAEHVSQDPVKAWRTVCVGLIVHPAFYTY